MAFLGMRNAVVNGAEAKQAYDWAADKHRQEVE